MENKEFLKNQKIILLRDSKCRPPVPKGTIGIITHTYPNGNIRIANNSGRRWKWEIVLTKNFPFSEFIEIIDSKKYFYNQLNIVTKDQLPKKSFYGNFIEMDKILFVMIEEENEVFYFKSIAERELKQFENEYVFVRNYEGKLDIIPVFKKIII